MNNDRSLIPLDMHYHYKSKIKPNMDYCCHIWVCVAKSSLTNLVRIQMGLRGFIFNPLALSPIDGTLQAYRNSIAIFMADVHKSYFLSFHQFNSSELGPNIPHTKGWIILIPFVYHWQGKISTSSWEPLLCGSNSRGDAFSTTTMLISSNIGSTVFYLIYPHNMHFLFLPLCPYNFI